MINKARTSIEEAVKNTNELRDLVSKHKLTQEKTAEMIRSQTNQVCALRTVAGWLAKPKDGETPLYKCPSWAVEALKQALLEKAD
jgi:hypothetical protein